MLFSCLLHVDIKIKSTAGVKHVQSDVHFISVIFPRGLEVNWNTPYYWVQKHSGCDEEWLKLNIKTSALYMLLYISKHP